MDTNKRFHVKQNGVLYSVTDTVTNKLLWTFEFKENEFASLACFISLIDMLNELNDENQHLKLKFRDMLEFIREKGTVTKSDIDNWWNTTSME